MTPLVDVMLVLVVIFILTAPLLVSAIKLDLPRADATKANTAPSFVTLTVNPAGQTFLNDQALDLAQLAQRLASAARANAQTEVQLRADASVPYGRIVQVMEVAQKAGLNRIGFVTVPADRQPPGTQAGARPAFKP